MRQITVRYQGNCRKCSADLPVGAAAIYEKHIGLFCPPCAPTDPEEIRQYRQEAGDRRADKYEEWANKREAKAKTQLNSHPSIRSDYAFITQPGHIPFRDRMIKADDRAHESIETARRFRQKASSLRHVRVAGDAEIARQAKRDAVLSWLRVGVLVNTVIYGIAKVEKINKKTATVTTDTFKTNVDLSFLRHI